MTNKVLVVVISYSNTDITNNCLGHLMTQTEDARVVLWDNGAHNEGYIEFEGDGLVSHYSKENVLWTPAINSAISKYWDGEPYIAFMNNDIYLPPEALSLMTKLMDEDPEVGMVGPMGSRLGGPQDWAGNIGSWPQGATNILNLQHHIRERPPKRATYLIGACCVLPSRVWATIGPLDPGMPLGADDHDYSIRLKHAGYQMLVAENVYADHIGHATGSSGQWNEWGGKSWDFFNKKWSNYYLDQAEAILCHWSGAYYPGWDTGTGWSTEEERNRIFEIRYALHKFNLQIKGYTEQVDDNYWKVRLGV